MKINKIKLAALPGLKDLYDQTHFKSHERACGFDGTWKGVVVNFHKHEKDDWPPQDCAQFFDFTQVKQLEKEPGRDDYAFVTDNEDYKVIWVCKMQPFRQYEGVYKLLGVGLSFPNMDYQSINLLVNDLEKRLI